jgi:hypothetical protein
MVDIILRRLVGPVAILSWLVIGAGVAVAQTSSTAQFQGAYRAYNAWDDWKWWLPDKCTQVQPMYGSEPAAAGRYPVLLYVHGMFADWGGNAEGRRIVEAAAGQGFLAAAVSYDSWAAGSQAAVDAHAKCMFGPSSGATALGQICARPKADCSKGVVLSGFSLGGAIAGRAANFSSQVRAAWLLGWVKGPENVAGLAAPTGTRALANDRLRITVGQSDLEIRNPSTGQISGIDVSGPNKVTGSNCSSSPCLRADGSGYYVVEHAMVADGVADHCYWMGVGVQAASDSCTWTPTLDPGFRPPSTAPWSLIANLEWLRTKLG